MTDTGKKFIFWGVGLCALALTACFSEPLQRFSPALSRDGINTPDFAVETDPGFRKATWTQQRPSNAQLDFLVLVDASGSLQDDFAALNLALSSFLQVVVEERINLCVGLTLADPDRSKIEKHLFHAPNAPAVVCTDGSNAQNAAFTADLTANFNRIVFDGTKDEGGLGALRNAIGPLRSKYESDGFFRDQAAISVLFMSDEADYYEANDGEGQCIGDSFFSIPVNLTPNGKAGFDCGESRYRYNFYSNEDGTRAWTLENLLADVRAFQGTLATSFALIGIRNFAQDKGIGGEVTYGYNEFIDLVDGAFAPIRLAHEAANEGQQENFNTALKSIAEGATQAATRLTVFDLPDLACLGNLKIEIEGNEVGSDTFRTSERNIEGKPITRIVINPSFVGEPGDLIEITYQLDDGTGGC